MRDYHPPLIDKQRCLAWSVDKAPCEAACPLGMDVEGYIAAAARRDFARALEIMRETCALPAVCGRVCHRPCESACKRGDLDAALAIRALKRFIADHAHDDGAAPESPHRTRKETIAIIGSGPAGLAAAYDLVSMGYGVTVFEARPRAGGMLAYGIPEFDLPQAVVEREIDYIRTLGVEIRTGVRIGEQLCLSDLIDGGYAAVLACTGAQRSATLPIEGANLEGVVYALDLLSKARLGNGFRLDGRGLVIGGGNVGIDVARTAVRLGAEEVRLACIEPRDEMPAFREMIALAERERVKISSALAPLRIASRDGARASSVELQRVASFQRATDGSVTWTLAVGADATHTVEVDWVAVAIGQKVALDGDLKRLDTSRRGTVIVDPASARTSIAGIHAAGDVVDVPSTVTEAMAAGRRAARAIDLQLRGGTPRETSEASAITARERLPRGISTQERAAMLLRALDGVSESFDEVELGFDLEQAVAEATRCLRCKTCLYCIERTQCAALVSVTANGKQAPRVMTDLCEACGRCARNCVYDHIEFGERR